MPNAPPEMAVGPEDTPVPVASAVEVEARFVLRISSPAGIGSSITTWRRACADFTVSRTRTNSPAAKLVAGWPWPAYVRYSRVTVNP